MQEELNLKSILLRNKKEIDEIALSFLPVANESPEIQGLYDMMRDYPSRGGKGLRGTLCLLWCELFGGKRRDAMISAAGLELFQNWILIHDDVEDASDIRRGLPTLHKKHGIELAINTGDALHGKMWELLLRNEQVIGSSLTLEVLSEFGKMLDETTEGQQMELTWNTRNVWDIGEKDYLLMVTKKSAWYTCISPARIGAIIGLGSVRSDDVFLLQKSKYLSALIDIGTDLGIAFQITDDVLNLIADEAKYGKEILGDIYEGKRTLMIIHLIQRADPESKRKLIEILSKNRQAKSKEDVLFVLEKMEEYGSIGYAKEIAQDHFRRAMSQFEILMSQDRNPDRGSLETTRQVFDYMITREY